MAINNEDEQGKKESEIQRTCLINIDNIDSCRWVAGHAIAVRWRETRKMKGFIVWNECIRVRVYVMFVHKCLCVHIRARTIFLNDKRVNAFFEFVIVVVAINDRRSQLALSILRYLTNRKSSSPERRGIASSALRKRARRKFKSTAPSPAELEQRLAFIAIIRGHGNGGKCNEVFRQIQFLLEPRRYPYPIGPL